MPTSIVAGAILLASEAFRRQARRADAGSMLKNNEGRLHVAYGNISALLFEATKEWA